MLGQVLINALGAASMYALVGVGFQLIFRTGKFFHFAHGAIITIAPYAMWTAMRQWDMPVGVSLVWALLLSVSVGIALEAFCYRLIRKAGGTANILLLASLGLFIAIQSLIAAYFGSEAKSLRSSPILNGYTIDGVPITASQIAIVAGAVCCLAGVQLFLNFTQGGKCFQAVSSNVEMARIIGISVDRIYMAAMSISSLMGAIAGILLSYDVDMRPTMGLAPATNAVVAVIIGGRTVAGIIGASILLGIVQHFGAIWISSRWQDAVTFIMLIIFLLLKPRSKKWLAKTDL